MTGGCYITMVNEILLPTIEWTWFGQFVVPVGWCNCEQTTHLVGPKWEHPTQSGHDKIHGNIQNRNFSKCQYYPNTSYVSKCCIFHRVQNVFKTLILHFNNNWFFLVIIHQRNCFNNYKKSVLKLQKWWEIFSNKKRTTLM